MSKGIAGRGLPSSPPRTVCGMSENADQRPGDGDVVEQRSTSSLIFQSLDAAEGLAAAGGALPPRRGGLEEGDRERRSCAAVPASY
jgi:hypothetical protein